MNDELYQIAKTYCGTPHINAGNIKGVGLDCCTLITNIVAEYYGLNVEVDFNYSGDWFCAASCKEILLQYLLKYCSCINSDNLQMRPGDIISYSWGRAKYAHLAMYLGDSKVIHCKADSGVEITDYNDPCFTCGSHSRISGIWRVKDEFIQKAINNN